jgi:hypothetical protein
VKLLLNARIANLNLIKTIEDIDNLKYREEVELLPTEYARGMAIALIGQAARSSLNYFYRPWLSGDDLGGVRVVWKRANFDAQVRLVVPPNTNTQIYIFSQIKEECAIEYNVSGEILAESIAKLCTIEIDNCQNQAKLGNIIGAKIAISSGS